MSYSRKVLEWMIGITIFLTAIGYIVGKPFAEVQLNAFRIGVPILFMLALITQPVRSIKNYFMPILGILCFVNTLLLKGNLVPLINIFLGIILFYIIANYVEDFKPIFWCIGGVIISTAIVVLLQALGVDPICVNEAGGHNTHMVGFFGFKYVFGAWMAIITPVMLFSKRWYLGVLSAILTICSFSFAGITLMILAIIYCIGRFKGVKIAVGLLLTAFFIGYGSYAYFLGQTSCGSEIKAYDHIDASGNFIGHFSGCKPCYIKGRTEKGNHILSMSYKIKTRWHLESKILPVLFSRPLTGYGLSSFQQIGPTIFNSQTDIYGTMVDAWNEWLERGCELGFPIIGLFLFYTLSTFRKFRMNKNYGLQGSLAIIPFGMLFHTYFIHTSICMLVLTLLAIWET